MLSDEELLNESIEQWEAIVEMSDDMVNVYDHECPLCRAYNSIGYNFLSGEVWCIDTDGNKCPIYEATGQPSCENTPWDNTRVAHSGYAGEIDSDTAMMEFLKDLRDGTYVPD